MLLFFPFFVLELVNDMKPINIAFLLIALLFAASVDSSAQTGQKAAGPAYDAELAKRLGGDKNGMKNYVVAILKTGPNDSKITGAERTEMFKGHMSNIGRLADEGKLAVAGPFGKNDATFRGIFILNTASVDEARKLVETDPVVKAGIMVVDLFPWFGSASLMATPEIHKKITAPSN
jgi:uncharacterized protein